MSTIQLKLLVWGIALVGYAALIEVWSYVVKRRFAPTLQRCDSER
jgi:hypothetical protein